MGGGDELCQAHSDFPVDGSDELDILKPSSELRFSNAFFSSCCSVLWSSTPNRVDPRTISVAQRLPYLVLDELIKWMLTLLQDSLRGSLRNAAGSQAVSDTGHL